MKEQELRDIFAEELDKTGERGLAEMVRSGHDNSHGGTAAMAALKRVDDAFACKARTGFTDPPQDCNWPFCGCDPRADKVMTAIEDSGFKIVKIGSPS